MFSGKISCKAKLGKEIHGIGKGWLFMGKRVGHKLRRAGNEQKRREGDSWVGSHKRPSNISKNSPMN